MGEAQALVEETYTGEVVAYARGGMKMLREVSNVALESRNGRV